MKLNIVGRFVILFFCCSGFAAAQSDILLSSFKSRISEIVKNSDAVVGISVKIPDSGELIAVNDKELFPTASSIKIFILAEVFRQAAAGKFSLNDILQVPLGARVGGSGVLSSLGERSVSMSVRDYAVLMMTLSDNTATNLLIDLVGMEQVNQFARSIGCTSTKLQRKMMDAQAAKEGRENISSPADFVTLLDLLRRREIVSAEASSDMLTIMKMNNGGWLRKGIPPSVEIASKSGNVEAVSCDAGIVYLGKNPYIICVMTTSLASDDDGGPIITSISSTVFRYLDRKFNSNKYGRRVGE